MNRNEQSYAVLPLPTLRADSEANTAELGRRDTLLMKIYDHTAQNWRELLGVRFKLLALVPTISILALAAILSSEGWGKGLAPPHKLLVAVLGFVMTAALFAYDTRNSSLYTDLFRRASQIEDELGVDIGAFRGRLNATGYVTHRLATNTIYIASCLAWAAAIVSLVAAQ